MSWDALDIPDLTDEERDAFAAALADELPARSSLTGLLRPGCVAIPGIAGAVCEASPGLVDLDSDRLWPRILVVDGSRIVDVTGALTGRYELLEEREDGTVVLSPDTSIAAIRRRLGTQPASAEEFEELFGDLPTGPA